MMCERKILVVDDEVDLLQMIETTLNTEGFTNVLTAISGDEALSLFCSENPDLILLDVMLPDMNGFSLLKKIRNSSVVPVIMLTAKGEANDRFNGFELGADDYIIKPFLPKELILRIQAVLRRVYPHDKKTLRLHASEVDLAKAQVYKNGSILPLTAKEFNILSKLAETPGCVVTIGSLCRAACGEIWEGYENSLMAHIRHIREKIEEDPSSPQSLILIRGLGYKLIIEET
ncbi:response regulator transcription factor [Roseburia faecis]|jgi:DNA-binding response OmpR family regulator|uniref:response regulator transcription factor n=1 Tax=Roseburia faecis TaxID=301302 RepID=UPI002ED5916C